MARLYKNLETSRNVGKLYILYTRKYLPPFIFALLPQSSLGDFQTEQLLLLNVFEQKQNHFWGKFKTRQSLKGWKISLYTKVSINYKNTDPNSDYIHVLRLQECVDLSQRGYWESFLFFLHLKSF